MDQRLGLVLTLLQSISILIFKDVQIMKSKAIQDTLSTDLVHGFGTERTELFLGSWRWVFEYILDEIGLGYVMLRYVVHDV